MIFDTKDSLDKRETIWLQAWLSVAGSSNSTRSNVAATWADACLADFDKRFTGLKSPTKETTK